MFGPPTFDPQALIEIAAVLVALGLLIFLAVYFLRRYLHNSQYLSHQVFLVRLPKETPDDEKQEGSVQKLREEIAKGETIFAAIGGLKAERGLRAWLFGRK